MFFLLFFFSGQLLVFLPADVPVQQDASQTDEQRYCKYRRRKNIISLPQGVAAYGGSDNTWDPCHQRNPQPVPHPQVGQPYCVAQQIFRCTGDHKDDKHQKLQPTAVLHKAQRHDLLFGEKDLHQLNAVAPYQQHHNSSAQHRTDQAQNGTLHRPEGIPCADLQRLSRNNGHDDLENHHADESQPPPNAVFIHPQAEFLRLRNKANHRSSYKPAQQPHKDYQPDDGGNAPYFLLAVSHLHLSSLLSQYGFYH